MIINNIPDYAGNFTYIVARLCENELWFWGAWNDEEVAYKVAAEIGGLVVQNI
jgi:hypothetical protein